MPRHHLFPLKVVSPWNATRVLRDDIDDLRHDIVHDSDGDDGEEVLIDRQLRLLKCKCDVRLDHWTGRPGWAVFLKPRRANLVGHSAAPLAYDGILDETTVLIP
jgi:hypothetical protein